MTKEQRIRKMVQDLPISDMLGEMNGTEWYGWFENCWNEAINFKHCCTELCDDKDKVFICENDTFMMRKCKKCGKIE
jgi:hypothetical protein